MKIEQIDHSIEGELFLPDEIDGEPVSEIVPYAFAEAEKVTVIRLPFGTKEVGKYAFYRCRSLKKLILSDSLLHIGGGALTGCRICEVEIHFYRGEQSCLRSILDEIRFAIRAVLYYHREDGSAEVAKVLFPEHYEEAVENTPARILETHHHGSGGFYRQCFYDHRLDYGKYDALLFRAKAQEEEDTVIELALSRLLYPYRLSHKHQVEYEEYLKAHSEASACFAVRQERMPEILYLKERGFFTEASLDRAIEVAAEEKKMEMLSRLMDIRYELFPKQKPGKTFEL